MTQLEQLAKPFPHALVSAPAKGKYGEYVSHDIVNQKLLSVLGGFTFKVVEIIYNRETGKVEGCLASLTCTVDGREVTITEVGDCEQPDNWKTQGARLKDCASDALKRCAMRLGCGLHLWSQDKYLLYDQLRKEPDAGDQSRGDPSIPGVRTARGRVAVGHEPDPAEQ